MLVSDRARIDATAAVGTRVTLAEGDFGRVLSVAATTSSSPPETRPIQAGESRRLQRLAAVAERVTLGDLEERTIDLRLVAER